MTCSTIIKQNTLLTWQYGNFLGYDYCKELFNRVSYNQNHGNHSALSHNTQTSIEPIKLEPNTCSLAKFRKTCVGESNQFWFCMHFWLVEKVTQVFKPITNCGKKMQITFWRSSENHSVPVIPVRDIKAPINSSFQSTKHSCSSRGPGKSHIQEGPKGTWWSIYTFNIVLIPGDLICSSVDLVQFQFGEQLIIGKNTLDAAKPGHNINSINYRGIAPVHV